MKPRALAREGAPAPHEPLLELVPAANHTQALGMFVVDEENATAIRRAWEAGGELAGVVELRRHFPLIADNAHARLCVRAIVGWSPRAAPDQEPSGREGG